MTILTRYIIQRLFVSSVFITVILTIAVWLTQSLRLVDVFINRGVSLSTFFKMIFLLLPDLVGIILPVGLLVAVLFIYSRLQADNELVIIRGTGMSDFRLIRPALIIAVGVTSILYAINLYFLPLAFQNFKDLEFRIRNTVNVGMIQPGEFNTFKDIMVYIRAHRKKMMTGILIHDARNPAKQYTVTSEYGKIVETPEGARLILMNGSRQERDPHTGIPSILSFDQYSVDLSTQDAMLQNRQRKPYERFLKDLLNPSDAINDLPLKRKLAVEAHQRILIPLTSLIFTLMALAIFLYGDYNRRSKTRKIVVSVVTCIVLESLVLSLVNMGEKFSAATFMAYFVVVAAIAGPLIYFKRKSAHFASRFP